MSVRYAMVDSDGVVRNIILWDGDADYYLEPGWTMRLASATDVVVGVSEYEPPAVGGEHPGVNTHLAMGLAPEVHSHPHTHDYAATTHTHPHTHDYADSTHTHPHTHPYAADTHTHPYAVDTHTHPYADLNHSHALQAHTHDYAPTDHSHAGSGSGETTTVKAAPQSNTTTTLQDIADLTFALAANERKHFRCKIFYTAAAATTGLAVAVNGPTASSVLASVEIATTATAVQNGVINALNGFVLGTSSLGLTPLWAVVEGWVQAGVTPGTAAIRFRSEVAASAVNILAGSTLSVWT